MAEKGFLLARSSIDISLLGSPFSQHSVLLFFYRTKLKGGINCPSPDIFSSSTTHCERGTKDHQICLRAGHKEKKAIVRERRALKYSHVH
ncbi:hypothetical protein AVEN_51445-1 [Araneus ventricosus]|uniref:Uncharacterized protein n=1 Tax=Araneus ventricosus TaxID=182803 RepID=A0A4Y2KDW7_ARAVE|nr:hypothetical protein AVEN_51445-1 [Araneus ventricosus]